MIPLHRLFPSLLLVASACAVCAAPVPPGTKKLPDTDEAVPVTGDDSTNIVNEGVSKERIRRIAIAVHNHASATMDQIPRDWADKNGKPLLSWRVIMAAFLDEDKLFREFKLDEAWDGPHNIKLLERMPAAFESPRVKAKKGYTVYQGFTGNGAMIGSGYTIENIPDGAANTIWCVEATVAVPWTKPVDIPFDPKKDLPKFGKAFCEKPLAVLADGSVRTLDLKQLSAKTLKNAICGKDGNVLGTDW